MYKVISEGQIIDLITNLKYLRYLYKSKQIVPSDSMSANCIQGSNNEIYGLKGNHFPLDFPHRLVIIKEIDKTEFDKLTLLFKDEATIDAEDPFLIKAKETKINELKSICDIEIINGICIKLSDDNYHSFELTIEDQLNLKSIESNLYKFKNGIIYHEKGNVCSVFSREDMQRILNASTRHIQYHTTYFNLMKYCINNMNAITDINNIRYGDEVPDKSYRALLSQI